MKNKPTRYNLESVSLKPFVSKTILPKSCLRAGADGVAEHLVGCRGICTEESGE